MAQRPRRAATKSKRPSKSKTAGKVETGAHADTAPASVAKPRAGAAKTVRKQTKPAATTKRPAAKAGKGVASASDDRAARVTRKTPISTVTKAASKKAASKSKTPKAAAKSAKATPKSAKATAAPKPAAPSKAARKAPKAAAATPKSPRARKTRPAPAYLAAELGQPVDHEGEPIGAGSPRVQGDGPLQEYALQLWRQMQSGGVVKRYLRAIERAGLTVDEVWTAGLGEEARSTSSTPDEMRRYKQRLLFRANLLEALLTETIADLHRLEGIEPTPPKGAVPEPTTSIPSEAA